MCNARTATAKKPFPDKQKYASQWVGNEYACLRCFVVSDVITPLPQERLRDERRRPSLMPYRTFPMNLRFGLDNCSSWRLKLNTLMREKFCDYQINGISLRRTLFV
jgi:hypothetical protein